MAETDTDQAAAGGPLCEHCEKRTVPASRGTKPRKYCSRSCVQRAYELRQRKLFVAAALKMEKEREHEQLRAALLAAEAREGKSREDATAPAVAPAAKSREDAEDLQERPAAKSRDDREARAKSREIPAPAAPPRSSKPLRPPVIPPRPAGKRGSLLPPPPGVRRDDG